MICPNCQASVLRKERTASVCSKCDRPFALDPRVHGRGMHDTRVRRVVERATDGGRRQVTVTQLWYLARTANRTWPATPRSGRSPWIGRSVGLVLLAGLVALGFAVQGVPRAGLIWWAGAGAAALGYAVARGRPLRPARRAAADLSPSLPEFRTMICSRWVQAYGGLPPGIVDDRTYRAATGTARRADGAARPETVELLCPDPAVRVFLSANGFPGRLDLTLAAALDELSGTGPVVVLHDASARGFQLVADARAGRPGGVVVDAGLPVRAVVGNRRAVTLHEDPPALLRLEPPQWLRRMRELAPQEAEWLAEGWFGPVASVPPALLEQAVERSVRRARDLTDERRRQAAKVGFLSWPRSAHTPVKDGN